MVLTQSAAAPAVRSSCEQVESALEKYIRLSSDCPDELRLAMRYSLLSPGKRLRPRLVLLAFEACIGSAFRAGADVPKTEAQETPTQESKAPEPKAQDPNPLAVDGAAIHRALPAACAVEMIHAYSLIHDDLPAMDDDDLRRGRPTCHKQFNEATAILAGDALQALAFQVLAQEIQPPEMAALCCAELAQAAGAESLVGGQMADLESEHSSGGLDLLKAIHRRKTGALLTVSLRLGALVAGASSEPLAALSTYGTCFGLAFQITDDLLDATGDEASMGKRVGKDDGRGKLTYPALLGIEKSRQMAQQLIAEGEAALARFGDSALPLVKLGHFVLSRDH